MPLYNRHPNSELNDLFLEKPYQGADPSLAKFLFVGLDANYDALIERSPIFPKLLEYHQDGTSFWRKYGVHHPFLLPAYGGDGRRYHQSFARIGLTPDHADHVSFVELLHFPTVGRNRLTGTDLDRSHLHRLNSAIIEGKATHVFIPRGVARLMKLSGAFSWLPNPDPSRVEDGIRLLCIMQDKVVYSPLHFSTYGRFEKRKNEELKALRNLLV